MPRVFALQAAGALPAGPSDSQQRSSDQQQPQPSKVQQLALADSAKAGAVSAKVKASSSGKVAIVQDTSSGSEALTFTAAQVRHCGLYYSSYTLAERRWPRGLATFPNLAVRGFHASMTAVSYVCALHVARRPLIEPGCCTFFHFPLRLPSLPQKQKTQNSGFSLGFGFGRKGSSSGGGSGTHFDGPALLSAGTLKSDDDMFISSNSKDLIGHGSRR